jgi:transcriptional regulator with XRE-family HTH domain
MTMINVLDPARDDAGARLRLLRLRRGMPQAVLAGLSSVTPSFLSMVENGHRELQRASDISALADALGVSPLYLAFGMSGEPGPCIPAPAPPSFPALPDAAILGRHQHLAGELAGFLARGDGCAAGNWLRRLARQPDISPWLLIDQFAARSGLRNAPLRPDLPHPRGVSPVLLPGGLARDG